MHSVLYSLGSNEGDRAQNLANAHILIETNVGEITKSSSIYETAAWGIQDQQDFYNQVGILHTSMTAKQVLEAFLEIEIKMGRERKEKWGSRIIDLDILFFDKEIIEMEGLSVPHKHLHERNFILIPLLEIAANHIHPKLHMTIAEIYSECSDISAVVKI